jgi:hypothetical protein
MFVSLVVTIAPARLGRRRQKAERAISRQFFQEPRLVRAHTAPLFFWVRRPDVLNTVTQRSVFLVDFVHAAPAHALVVLAVVLETRGVFRQQRVCPADFDHALEQDFVLVVYAVVVL